MVSINKVQYFYWMPNSIVKFNNYKGMETKSTIVDRCNIHFSNIRKHIPSLEHVM